MPPSPIEGAGVLAFITVVGSKLIGGGPIGEIFIRVL
jgi:hypothetical protein